MTYKLSSDDFFKELKRKIDNYKDPNDLFKKIGNNLSNDEWGTGLESFHTGLWFNNEIKNKEKTNKQGFFKRHLPEIVGSLCAAIIVSLIMSLFLFLVNKQYKTKNNKTHIEEKYEDRFNERNIY